MIYNLLDLLASFKNFKWGASTSFYSAKLCMTVKNNCVVQITSCELAFPGGVHSQEMPGTEVPLGWVAIFEFKYRDGSRFLPSV